MGLILIHSAIPEYSSSPKGHVYPSALLREAALPMALYTGLAPAWKHITNTADTDPGVDV